MNKDILNEVKRNRELMGINESELDEQGIFRGVRDGIKKGFQKGKEAIKNTVDNIKDKLDGDEEEVEVEVKKYNNKPIDEIIQDVRDTNKSEGKIDVNGETLYFGVADSTDREIAKKKARNNAEIAAAEDLRISNEDFKVSGFLNKVQRLTMGEDNDFISYILISNSNVD
jgi:hypothetical protein